MILVARHAALRATRVSSVTAPHFPTMSFFRLASTLAVLEQRDGKLSGGSLCAVTAGKRIGGSVTGFIAGSNIKVVADQAARGNGMDKVVMVDNGAYDKVQQAFVHQLFARILTYLGSARELCSIAR